MQSSAGAEEQAAARLRRAEAKRAREAEALRALDAGECDDVIVTLKDAREAGLRERGILSWLSLNFNDPNLRGLSVGEIRKIADQSELARRACERAVTR